MLKLDHVVYFTEKSPAEVVVEQKGLGWHAVVGGSHEKWGTQNALMYMNNSYIEWLSVEHRDFAEKANHQLVDLLLRDISEGENWGTICFSVKGIDAFNESIREVGYKTSGVLNAERKTTSGNIRKWKMLFVEQQSSINLPQPFFIEWEEEDELRFNKLREDGTLSADNEKLKITECHFTVNEPEAEARKWAVLLSANITHKNTIVLSNTVLKFIKNEFGNKKERLTDVVIEHM